MTSFEKDLAALINKHGLDRDTDTSDFILAQFLNNCLSAWNVSTKHPAPVAAQGGK